MQQDRCNDNNLRRRHNCRLSVCLGPETVKVGSGFMKMKNEDVQAGEGADDDIDEGT